MATKKKTTRKKTTHTKRKNTPRTKRKNLSKTSTRKKTIKRATTQHKKTTRKKKPTPTPRKSASKKRSTHKKNTLPKLRVQTLSRAVTLLERQTKQLRKKQFTIHRAVNSITLAMHSNALANAKHDLETQTKQLKKRKEAVNTALEQLTSMLGYTHKHQKGLQRKVTKLIEQELKFNEEKKQLELNLAYLTHEVARINKIKTLMLTQ